MLRSHSHSSLIVRSVNFASSETVYLLRGNKNSTPLDFEGRFIEAAQYVSITLLKFFKFIYLFIYFFLNHLSILFFHSFNKSRNG
jgi:hypothetical protein